VNLNYGQIEKALKFLSVESPAPVLKDGSTWRRTPVSFKLDRERIEHLTHQREIEWDEVQAYIGAVSCRMAYLRNALDDPSGLDCGRCDNCQSDAALSATVDESLVVEATRFLRTSEMPLEPRKVIFQGMFEVYDLAGRLTDELRAREGRILSRWGDAGWGVMVADDKRNGRFRDELVEAVTEMFTDRWMPEPAAKWVTCVPSSRHPELVRDFAGRLAARLGLPFVEALRKVRDNQPQKVQENSYHRCRNLDGVFEVMTEIPRGPVLLVDDIVDSGWTLTVLAALLGQHGAGPVFPLALASTSRGN